MSEFGPNDFYRKHTTPWGKFQSRINPKSALRGQNQRKWRFWKYRDNLLQVTIKNLLAELKSRYIHRRVARRLRSVDKISWEIRPKWCGVCHLGSEGVCCLASAGDVVLRPRGGVSLECYMDMPSWRLLVIQLAALLMT